MPTTIVPNDPMSRLVCQVVLYEIGEVCNSIHFTVRHINARRLYTCARCGEIYDDITPPGEKDG